MKLPKKAVKVLSPLHNYLEREALSGLLLLGCIAIALGLANSPYSGLYEAFWQWPVTIGLGQFVTSHSLHFWINEGLMTLFFVVVGLEIKREVLVGELSSLKNAALPIAGAIGGMVLPALIFSLLNKPGTLENAGWGIPIATDIAFAIGILMLFGSRVPLALKVFLLALAIVDDIGAILVIALFYSKGISWFSLAVAVALLVLLLLLNRFRVYSSLPYVILGIALWLAVLNSGIHATIAGVLLAFTIPAGSTLVPGDFLQKNRQFTQTLRNRETLPERVLGDRRYKAGIWQLEKHCKDALDPLQRIEHALHPWVTYMILPLFALANAGVSLSGGLSLTNTLTWGIIAGLLVGKPLGITGFVWLAKRFNLATLPQGITLGQILGVGFLGGIGFTMSMFMANLSFIEPLLLEKSKIGILLASFLAGCIGSMILNRQLR